MILKYLTIVSYFVYGLRLHFSSWGQCRFFPFAYLLIYPQVGHPLTLSIPLSCPQISTAYIMRSQLSALAGGLSLKKAESYYCHGEIPLFIKKFKNIVFSTKK